MVATVAMVSAGVAILGLAIWVAIREAKARAQADADSRLARRAMRARDAMDNLMSRGVGRRQKLIDFLKRQETGREGNE